MDSDITPEISVPVTNFTFAFNNTTFSDRILKIEILPDFPVHKPDTEDSRNLKRRREDVLVETSDEAIHNSSCTKEDYSVVLQTKTLHISSPIFAAKSPFFYKLFLNGMRESNQRELTLRIQASEEYALMELLNFMYTNTLTTKEPSTLIDVLKAADKYEVDSCISYCSKLLPHLPITCESALLYLELPSISTFASVIETAKHFLADRYKDLTKYKEEVLNLPIAGIEAVLLSDDLRVCSEDDVYDFVVEWANNNHPNIKERQNVMTTRLGNLIRFPHMTLEKLASLTEYNDFNFKSRQYYISEALSFKAECPYQQGLLAEIAKTSHSRFVERSYIVRPIKLVELESPFQQSVVYFDLKKEECANLFPSNEVISQEFHVGPNIFSLYAKCSINQESTCHSFGLFLCLEGLIIESSLVVDYEFAARKNTTKEFENPRKITCDFTETSGRGYQNLFGISWEEFMADDSIYFINGVLHLRATMIIKQ